MVCVFNLVGCVRLYKVLVVMWFLFGIIVISRLMLCCVSVCWMVSIVVCLVCVLVCVW